MSTRGVGTEKGEELATPSWTLGERGQPRLTGNVLIRGMARSPVLLLSGKTARPCLRAEERRAHTRGRQNQRQCGAQGWGEETDWHGEQLLGGRSPRPPAGPQAGPGGSSGAESRGHITCWRGRFHSGGEGTGVKHRQQELKAPGSGGSTSPLSAAPGAAASQPPSTAAPRLPVLWAGQPAPPPPPAAWR